MILSIDVGIRNLAMCLYDDSTTEIVEWDVSGVPPESSAGLYPCFRKHLDERAWTLRADTILIEKQPDRNKKMVSGMHFLHAYFVIKRPDATTILYDARHKVADCPGRGRELYLRRKQMAVDRCREFLQESSVNQRWRSVFDSSKKKDDLADTVLQALSYARRVDVAAAEPSSAASKPDKIRPRQPTEHQKRSKYSKSNLAYLYSNAKATSTSALEALLQRKRFLKDVSRYFTSVEEFVKAIQTPCHSQSLDL